MHLEMLYISTQTTGNAETVQLDSASGRCDAHAERPDQMFAPQHAEAHQSRWHFGAQSAAKGARRASVPERFSGGAATAALAGDQFGRQARRADRGHWRVHYAHAGRCD